MERYKKYFVYGGFVIWFILIVVIILYAFFPYQKVMKIVFQNFLGGNRVIVSIEGARVGPFGAKASKVTFGHEIIQGKPLFEIENAYINWRFLPIFRGVIDIASSAKIYNGNMKMNIDNLPFIANSTPVVTIKMDNIMLSKYPEGRLPWFKGLSGTMGGWIKKEMPLYSPEKQKGSFAFNLTYGEIKELAPKNFPKLTIPFKSIAIEGKISGERINLSRISIESPDGSVINGVGHLDTNEFEPKVNLDLTYESKGSNSPLPGKGKITVSGSRWLLDVSITPERADSTSPSVQDSPKKAK